jgi:hypothetical protein
MPSTASQIVQAVRQSEQWVGQVDSLVLRFDVTWTKTSEGLACRKDMLARRFPGQVLDPNQYVDLQPVARGRLEYAFDRQRMRFVNELAGYWAYLTVWDGRQLIRQEAQSCPERRWTILEDQMKDTFDNCLAPMSSLRSGPLGFWWNSEEAEAILPTYGMPAEFVATGRCTYRGVDCQVLEVSPREVRGLMIGHGPSLTFGADREYGFIGEVKGVIDQAFRWYAGEKDHRLYGVVCMSEGRPFAEYWLSQYKEVAKGCWFPMVQGSEVYEKPDFGKPYVDCRCEMKVADLRVNEPLPDSLFKVDLASNGRLVDRRQVACKADDRDTGLVGRRLPPLTELGLEPDPCGGPDKGILICLFDWQQRPSRRLLTQLAEKAGSLREKGVAVLAVQASQTDRGSLDAWLKKQGMDIAVGTLASDAEPTTAGLGTKALPWLILADKEHKVAAEGFAVSEVDARLKEVGLAVAAGSATASEQGRAGGSPSSGGDGQWVLSGPLYVGSMQLFFANLSVTGTVKDDQGRPMAQVTVHCSGRDQPSCWAQTDIQGRFTLDKVCAGPIYLSATARSGERWVLGQARTEGGATGVEIVIRDPRPAPPGGLKDAAPLKGRPLPAFKGIQIDLDKTPLKDERILVCFFDMEQRPSRQAAQRLSSQAASLAEKGLVVLAIDLSKVDVSVRSQWIRDQKIQIPVGLVTGDPDEVRVAWAVKALPWLVLADAGHVVKAEGFAVGEMDAILAR